MTFGKMLKKKIKEKGITRKELSEMTGIAYTSLCEYEYYPDCHAKMEAWKLKILTKELEWDISEVIELIKVPKGVNKCTTRKPSSSISGHSS